MKVQHPTLPGVSKTISDDLAEKFLSNGWVEVAPPKPVAPAPAKRAAAKKKS